MSFHLVAVGKLKAAEKELYDRYAKRLGKTLNLTELPDSQASKVGESWPIINGACRLIEF